VVNDSPSKKYLSHPKVELGHWFKRYFVKLPDLLHGKFYEIKLEPAESQKFGVVVQGSITPEERQNKSLKVYTSVSSRLRIGI
jgi:hypothetical protein